MSIFSSKKNAIVKDVYIFLVSVLEHHSILLTCTCFTLARACNSVKWTMSATMDVHALNVVFYKAKEISQQGLVKIDNMYAILRAILWLFIEEDIKILPA